MDITPNYYIAGISIPSHEAESLIIEASNRLPKPNPMEIVGSRYRVTIPLMSICKLIQANKFTTEASYHVDFRIRYVTYLLKLNKVDKMLNRGNGSYTNQKGMLYVWTFEKFEQTKL